MGTSSRVPAWQQIAQVYAVIVMMIYGWTILLFLWRFPSWKNFLGSGEILTVFAYSMATNLLESLTVLVAPVLAGLLLPAKWFRDVFVARGAALVISGLGYMMYVARQFRSNDDYPSLSLNPWSLVVALTAVLLLVGLAGKISILRRSLEILADRATIFLFLTIPLSLLAILVVLVRWVAL